MTLTTDIDRIEEALNEAYNNPGTAERVFAQKGLPEFRVMRYLETRGLITASGAWIGDKPTRTLAGWVREECGTLKPVKAKRVVQTRTGPDPVEMILLEAGYIVPRCESEVDGFERAMKRRKDVPPLPAELNDPDAILARAMNWKQSNVMTREEWEWHVKNLEE